MLSSLITKVVGTKNDRELKRLAPLADQTNLAETAMRARSDAELRALTGELKEKVNQGASLDEILPEAFGVVREAAIRTLGQRPFDVQVIGGIVLHLGRIAEMKTGEGKTLAATMPVYLNALAGKGVHVVTVNDYLARRDAQWMGAIYRFLGLDVGVILHDMSDEDRRKAYGADITYGTNNEFGFDYLRDNMKYSLDDYVQRDFYYAIVDEVDSILVDEARTPLIISGPSEQSTELYYRLNQIIPRLKRENDFTVEEKTRTVSLTEEGVAHAEKLLKIDNLYDPKYIEVLHHLNQALKAHSLFKKDVDYIVKSGEVIIVDEFTGRLMPGRRYSEGLHQALEAKEGVKIERENQTLASITFQNYFRMYEKLAGMTGTADTEAAEFKKIYKLDVMVIPTNNEMIRIDNPDLIYRTEQEKFDAAVEEIKELHDEGRPVLVGTISIENSERMSKVLKKRGIKHSILNAKQHEKEAEIVAMAGQPGAVTISTNMAGRGTDIVLGPGVAEKGGLHILGTERHESRRIDNQLRGRSGRQGDRGSSRFYMSLEDDLLRIFGSDRISGLMDRLGMEGEPIEHNLVSRGIENAQRRVEGHNFEIRKHLLEYDDVMNKQREVVYSQRRQVLQGDLKEEILEMISDQATHIIEQFTGADTGFEDWEVDNLTEALYNHFGKRFRWTDQDREEMSQGILIENVVEKLREAYMQKEREIGSEDMRYLEGVVMLTNLDSLWKDHLLAMDHLKEGIGLRGYGQQDPLRAYQKEGYEMFLGLLDRVKENTVRQLFRIKLERETSPQVAYEPKEQEMVMSRGGDGGSKQPVRQGNKVGRNAPCPCGSGKKYKKCCGR